MQSRATHRKNASTLLTARTKRTSADSKTREHGSRSKDKPADLALQNKIQKRMSFKSPSRKNSIAAASNAPYQNLSLLNYLLFKEKKGSLQIKIPSPSRASQVLSREGFTVR